jgi:hypothetical protein
MEQKDRENNVIIVVYTKSIFSDPNIRQQICTPANASREM